MMIMHLMKIVLMLVTIHYDHYACKMFHFLRRPEKRSANIELADKLSTNMAV